MKDFTELTQAGRSIRRKRLRALEKWGKECACCGEQRWYLLTIDHIDGDGAKDRVNRQGSLDMWQKYLEADSGLQVLCQNCNWAKGVDAFCPCQSDKSTLEDEINRIASIRRYVTPEEAETIKQLREQGLTLNEISKAVGWSKASVLYTLQKPARTFVGHTYPGSSRFILDDEKETMRQMAAKGMSVREIGQATGRSYASIRKIISQS